MKMNLMCKQSILLMVRALYFCMEDEWAELAKKYDITPAQQHILFLLMTNGKSLTPSQISELGCWHNSTVTRLLKPLQERKYIHVALDCKKPKYKKVTITAAGEKLLHQLVGTVMEMKRFPLDMRYVTEREISFFLEIGQKILDAHKGEEFMKKVVHAKMEDVDYA